MTRKQIKAQAARYTKFVEWSDEDQCFIGRCPEIMGGGVHGGDEERVYAELCQAIEEMLELIHADGHTLPEPLSTIQDGVFDKLAQLHRHRPTGGRKQRLGHR